jgi:D-alanyl-lipoteichoic acid acyltransferase DltB (MBOAT superfamily)
MAFNSLEYFFFYLAVATLSWMLLRRPQARVWLLLLASYYFYASNNHWILILLLVTTMIDYAAGLRIQASSHPANRRAWLIASLCGNLGMLGFFKYFNFFADTIAGLAAAAGLHLGWVELNIFLPAGISFYTFESLSYVIDVYRGALPAERSWTRYACFVAFFPHLIAGPIVRPAVFLPQLDPKSPLSQESLEVGLSLIFQGLFKKIVLADFLATFADAGFDHPAQANWWTVLVATYAFTFQIYYDFSGYTDIAIGCSKLMGINLPENFHRPYASMSITEFWRRWHISLSSWLRDYLYIPLGGNRMRSRLGVERNLMITMLLGGLWHGAAWHFVLWGGLQGLLLVVERRFGVARDRQDRSGSAQVFALIGTFHLVCFSWILFRAPDTASLIEFGRAFTRPAGASMPGTVGTLVALAVVGVGLLVQQIGERVEFAKSFLALPLPVKAATYAAIGACVMVMGSSGGVPFIYFQF